MPQLHNRFSHDQVAFLFRASAQGLMSRAEVQEALDIAKTMLEEGRSAAEALGSRQILWEIIANLAEVEAELGDEAQAARYWKRAREVVDFISENAVSDELRESFLRRPAVQSLMDA